MSSSLAEDLLKAQMKAAAGALIQARGKPAVRQVMVARIRNIRELIGATKEQFFECFREVARDYEMRAALELAKV